jgi:predicted ester cyclase
MIRGSIASIVWDSPTHCTMILPTPWCTGSKRVVFAATVHLKGYLVIPAELSRRFIEEVINYRNLNLIDELVAEAYVELDPFPDQPPGRQGVRENTKSVQDAFSDLHWEVLEQVSEGNKVVTRCTWTGTHDGALDSLPATGKQVRIDAVMFDEWENGRKVRSRFLQGEWHMRKQLGLVQERS